MRVFVNTILGEAWRTEGDEIDQTALIGQAEAFDLDHIPAEVLAVTVGADIQDDRVECSVLGHSKDGTIFVLAHFTVWGSPLDDDTWFEVDKLLKLRWRHPLGGELKVDAAVIDAGDGGVFDVVLRFCSSRLSRRVLAGKGAAGFGRPMIQVSKTKRGRLFIIGVDGIKSQIFSRLARGRTIRFSHTLEAVYYEQLASEKRVVRMARGKPVARFERKVGARAETLDCMVYAVAAKAAINLSPGVFSAREDELRAPASAKPRPTVIRSEWMSR